MSTVASSSHFNGSIFRSLLNEPDADVVRAQLRTWQQTVWNPNDLHRGYPLLMTAISKRSVIMTAELLECGANPNVASETITPLMVAVVVNVPEIIALLVEAGATLEAEDLRGVTALLRAAEELHPNALRELLRLGANPLHRNHADESALDIASQSLRELREQAPEGAPIQEHIRERFEAVQTLLYSAVSDREEKTDDVSAQPPLPVMEANKVKRKAGELELFPRIFVGSAAAVFFAIGGGCLSMPITARLIPHLTFQTWGTITNIIAAMLLPVGFIYGFRLAQRADEKSR